VLGGRVIAELGYNGEKVKGYVYAGGEVLAKQESNTVSWQHTDPLTGSQGESQSTGSYTQTVEADPMGINVGAPGNRISITDRSSNVRYQYDQLSCLTLETKQFTDLPGKSYPLSYSYNLGGELASVTDPAGAVINYAYDQTGRMTGVTGTTFAGVTSYATNM
jgi:YD repeat-containing protein